MQLTTIATFVSLAALGVAPSVLSQSIPISATACTPGQYSCGYRNGQDAIYICSNGRLVFAASCGSGRCESIAGVPHCV
ncbi:hypothetical protein L209DRAFT_799066 [Thermothelomyces heterothallicus CBS 203.75]